MARDINNNANNILIKIYVRYDARFTILLLGDMDHFGFSADLPDLVNIDQEKHLSTHNKNLRNLIKKKCVSLVVYSAFLMREHVIVLTLWLQNPKNKATAFACAQQFCNPCPARGKIMIKMKHKSCYAKNDFKVLKVHYLFRENRF